MMASPNIVIYLTCLFFGKMAQATYQKSISFHQQQSGFVTANVGENLTLQCFYGKDEPKMIYWFKQSLGERPRLMSTSYLFGKSVTFLDEFKNNSRFTLEAETGKNHLKISNLRTSDSATYHCAIRISTTTEFVEGTLVSVKGVGLNIPALVHQSESETIQPGGSVTVNCTVQTGTCDGDHNVYWFKNSKDSHPGLMYTHGGRNDQCERNIQTQTCVYNLPVKTLDLSHAGTYDCAVASCGHILFGNGSNPNFKGEVDPLVYHLVYFLGGVLTFTTMLSVLLAFLVYKMNKRNACHCTESEARFRSAEGYKDAESLHYAALSFNLPNRSGRQRDITNEECVYSGVKQ